MLSCAFPAYNEEENIGPLLDEALRELPRLADDFEIVVVDDGSRDSTAEIVRRYAAEHQTVRLVSHPQNLGYGHALRSALVHSRGDLVAWIDGDRQFRVADLAVLLAALDGYDVVWGYRMKRADPALRLLIARVYKVVLRATFDLNVRDVDCGFRIMRRRVVDVVGPQLESRSAFISPELAIRSQQAGFLITEAGVPHHPRIAGHPGGATPRVIARTIGEILRLRRRLGRPRRRAA